jgi:hypothetical protein
MQGSAKWRSGLFRWGSTCLLRGGVAGLARSTRLLVPIGSANPDRKQAMRDYRYDHVHLRSPDPDATARFFEAMFRAEVTRSI